MANKNCMFLNKLKSGIVCFSPRHALKISLMRLQKTKETRRRKYKSRKAVFKNNLEITHSEWVPADGEILGILVCSKYKYLGTYLTSKLTLKSQIVLIKKKSSLSSNRICSLF